MPHRIKIGARHDLGSLARAAVDVAVRNGRLINATEEARRILAGAKNAGITEDQLAEQIARLADKKGVSVKFG